MTFMAPPSSLAWQHRDARDGFEVAFFEPTDGESYRVTGFTSAVEAGDAWAVRYDIVLTGEWRTVRARAWTHTVAGRRETVVESTAPGRWLVDGVEAPQLDGCLDVDLESSALTNAFPVHRLGLRTGKSADAPAAYVRALDLAVERLEQRYVRLEDRSGQQCYDYTAPAFDVRCELVYDAAGFVTTYPGLAVQVR